MRRLGRVVYGCADPKAGACGSVCRLNRRDARLNRRVAPIAGVLGDGRRSCSAGFSESGGGRRMGMGERSDIPLRGFMELQSVNQRSEHNWNDRRGRWGAAGGICGHLRSTGWRGWIRPGPAR